MPQLFDMQLNVCYACGKPLFISHKNCDKNLQIVEISKEDYFYDETYDIYLCDECYIPQQVIEVVS